MHCLLWAVLLLASCTSAEDNFSSRLNRWIGSTPQALIENWGMPDNGQTVGPETDIYTYILRSQSGLSQPYPDEVVYSAIDGPDFGPNPNADPVYYCRISFIIRDGVIASYNFNGDNCRSNILPAD